MAGRGVRRRDGKHAVTGQELRSEIRSEIRSWPGSVALLLARLVLGVLFAWAAWNKLQNPQAFAFAIDGFEILPRHLAVLGAFAIPWIEALSALALLAGLWTRAAATILALLLVVFMVSIGSVIARKLSVSCGCFGEYSKLLCGEKIGWCNIGQNVALLVIAAPLAWFGAGRVGVDALGVSRAPDAPAA